MNTRIKKILIFSILSIIIIFSAINCNLVQEENGSGNVIIITPKSVPINRLVAGMNIDQALDLNGSVRYEVVVESNGQRIKSVILKSDDSTEITIPSGIKLDIGVGLFLAVNSTNNDELINAYLVTDRKKNFTAMPNQTVYLDFTLDFNKPTVIDYYYPNSTYPNAPGMSEVTGAVIYNSLNIPMFTTKNLLSDTINPYRILAFNSPALANITGANNEGKLFKVDDPSGSGLQAYWYLDTEALNVRFESGGLTGLPGSLPLAVRGLSYDEPGITNQKLRDVYMLESIRYDGTFRYYYYFFIYKTGMLTVRYNGQTSVWGNVTDVDFSPFASILPELPFVFDVERDADSNGDNVFFASKIGLFFIDHVAMDYFADERYNEAVNRLKRLIRIPDPFDDRKSIMITGVKVLGNNIYLGTRYGLYKINKSSKAWASFRVKSPGGDFTVFDADSIEKVKSFKNNPISALESDGSNILAVAAANSVYFKNAATGQERELTVWDGMPFIPSRSLVFKPEYNNIDFYEHGQSPVKFILWDGNPASNRFWIGTKHGLASIDRADLF